MYEVCKNKRNIKFICYVFLYAKVLGTQKSQITKNTKKQIKSGRKIKKMP